MNFLLRLKHWQLFAITWGSGILLNIFAIADPLLVIKLLPIIMILFITGSFGWVWAIATGLQQKISSPVDLNVNRFKIMFAIPVVYILLLCIGMGIIFIGGNRDIISEMGGFVAIIVLLHLVSMGCIFYGMLFAAKTLRSAELGREAHFGDYVGEFFLIWFSIIGFWILQPRINRLAGPNSTPATA